MIPLWVYIGFGAQFLWVLGAIIDKGLLEKYFDDEATDSPEVLLLISGCFSALIAVGVLTLFSGQITFNQLALLTGIPAGLCSALWVHLYLKALDLTEVSRAVPIFQSIPVFGLIFAYFTLGEKLAYIEIIGIGLVLIGAFTLSYHWTTKDWSLKPLLLMLLASAAVALQETLFKVTAEASSYWTATALLTGAFTFYTLIIFIRNRSARKMFLSTFKPASRPLWFASTFNEAADNAANLLFAFAITLGPVALVQSTNAFQPLILLVTVTILAKFFGNHLKEDISFQTLTQKILGISILSIGSVILYTAIT